MTYENFRWFWVGGTGQQLFVSFTAQNGSGVLAALLVGLGGLGIAALLHRYRIRIEQQDTDRAGGRG